MLILQETDGVGQSPRGCEGTFALQLFLVRMINSDVQPLLKSKYPECQEAYPNILYWYIYYSRKSICIIDKEKNIVNFSEPQVIL